MHRMGIMTTLAIMDTINGFFESIVEDVTFYLENIQPWAAGVILLAAAIFVLTGFFVILKKFIKGFIVIAILGAAFYVVYTQTDLLSNILKIVI